MHMFHAFDAPEMLARMARDYPHAGQLEAQWRNTQQSPVTAVMQEHERAPRRVPPHAAWHAPPPPAVVDTIPRRTRRRLFEDNVRAAEVHSTTLAQRRMPARMPMHVVVPPPRVFASLPPRTQPHVDTEQHDFQQSMRAQVAVRQQWETETAHTRLSDDGLWPQYGMHMQSPAQIRAIGAAALRRTAQQWDC